jgi:transcriptional regulator with XRE-family HTH domain
MNGRALLAWNLRRLRVERGVSQERLAADSAVDRAYMSQMERGIGNATLDVLDRLAEVLGVQIGEFFVVPDADAERPKSLPSGRRPKAQ